MKLKLRSKEKTRFKFIKYILHYLKKQLYF